MKKWKTIKFITLIVLVVFIMYLAYDAIKCINMNYPHPTLGIDAYTWLDQFIVDLTFIFIIYGIPLIIDTIIFIISLIKIKKLKSM